MSKKTETVKIRATEKQKKRWIQQTKMGGYKTLSQMIVSYLDNSPFIFVDSKSAKTTIGKKKGPVEKA